MAAKAKSVTSPTKGWNTRDSQSSMKEGYALLLDNWFPTEGRVEIRPGYTEHCTGLGANVETLAEYRSDTVHKLLAASNGNIWDVTTSTPSSLASGFSSNRWQTVNMDGKIGFVNGVDAPQQYDGTTLGAMTISGTSLTVTDLVGVNVFKGRSYFWEDNNQDFWYSSVNALGGALTQFPLSRVGSFGGKLLSMGTWTRDAGDGMDDLAVFLMTSGEVIVYSGSDPGSDFSLIGVFRIGSPLAQRGMIKIGGDLFIITKDGYVSLQSVISQGRFGNKGLLSDQINEAVTLATKNYKSNYGWQAFHYPAGDMLIFNIPVSTNATYQQHIFNTVTGAPCRFTGIHSRCWGLFDDEAYFGGNGVVYKFDSGPDDNGNYIGADCVLAPDYLGPKHQQKLVTAIQPVIASDGQVQTSIDVKGDFKTPLVTFIDGTYSGGPTDWGTADWDTATWSSGDSISKDWISTGSFGYSFNTRMRIRARYQNVKWYAVNYMFEPAGLI